MLPDFLMPCEELDGSIEPFPESSYPTLTDFFLWFELESRIYVISLKLSHELGAHSECITVQFRNCEYW